MLRRDGLDYWRVMQRTGGPDGAPLDIPRVSLGMILGANGPPDPMQFERVLACAVWASQAFPVIELDAMFAASMACTTLSPDVLAELRSPWDAFMIELPEGVIATETQRVSTLLVHGEKVDDAQNWSVLGLWAPWDNLPEQRKCWLFHGLEGADLIEEQVDMTRVDVTGAGLDRSDLRDRDLHERVRLLAGRIVANVCAIMTNNPERVKRKPRVLRTATGRKRKLGKRATPDFNHFTVGHPVRVDCRPAIREYLSGRGKGASPKVQTLVQGHSKMQAYGRGRALRKLIHVEPYWRGPEDAPIVVRPHRVKGPEDPD